MKLSRTLPILLAGALVAPVAWAQILSLTLEEMVVQTDDAIYGEIVDRSVAVYDHPVDGPENYFTTITIRGRSLNDGKEKTVAVVYRGGFLDPEHGVYNSEAPSEDDTKQGNKIVAFYKWTDDMGCEVAGNALYAAHGGLYRTSTTRRGTVVLGRGEDYAVSSNMNIESLGAEIKKIAAEKKQERNK